MMETYTRVRLISNRYQKQGVSCSEIGYVIEVYPDGKCEIEFSDLNGITTAQMVVSEEELQPVPPTFDAPSAGWQRSQ